MNELMEIMKPKRMGSAQDISDILRLMPAKDFWRRKLVSKIDEVEKRFDGYKFNLNYGKVLSRVIADSRRVLSNPQPGHDDCKNEIRKLTSLLKS